LVAIAFPASIAVRTDAGAAARADLDSTAPVPWDAYYRIGSTTKTFTATIASQLVAEGRLRLGDTVERWLPGVLRGNGNDGTRVTVENLLRQTSGLNDYDDQLPWAREFTPERFHQERFHAYTPRDLVTLATMTNTARPTTLNRSRGPSNSRDSSRRHADSVRLGCVCK
jgi:D-alanyl-D-alanine carboxypeptidase